MFKIALCDDEVYYIEIVKDLLRSYSVEKDIDILVEAFNCGKSLLDSKEEFDVFFLDIAMEGIDGIETARVIRQDNDLVPIVFLTSHLEHTMAAFSVHANGYIEKPIMKNKLYKTLDIVLTLVSKIKGHHQLFSETVHFDTTVGEVILKASDIYYFEYERRWVKIVTTSGVFETKSSITAIEKMMDKYHFLMPHQSFLVNPNHIINIKKDRIVMKNKDSILLAQKRSHKFKEKFHEYAKKFL